jgi:hypothetical protein
MTVVVTDNKKRVTLPLAKAGDRFDVQVVSDGNYVLRFFDVISGIEAC